LFAKSVYCSISNFEPKDLDCFVEATIQKAIIADQFVFHLANYKEFHLIKQYIDDIRFPNIVLSFRTIYTCELIKIMPLIYSPHIRLSIAADFIYCCFIDFDQDQLFHLAFAVLFKHISTKLFCIMTKNNAKNFNKAVESIDVINDSGTRICIDGMSIREFLAQKI
jgi:hypothetical protein